MQTERSILRPNIPVYLLKDIKFQMSLCVSLLWFLRRRKEQFAKPIASNLESREKDEPIFQIRPLGLGRMPGAWDSTSSITLPDEIALNYEDKNKKLGEGNAFRGFLPKKTSLSFKCLQRRLYKDASLTTVPYSSRARRREKSVVLELIKRLLQGKNKFLIC